MYIRKIALQNHFYRSHLCWFLIRCPLYCLCKVVRHKFRIECSIYFEVLTWICHTRQRNERKYFNFDIVIFQSQYFTFEMHLKKGIKLSIMEVLELYLCSQKCPEKMAESCLAWIIMSEFLWCFGMKAPKSNRIFKASETRVGDVFVVIVYHSHLLRYGHVLLTKWSVSNHLFFLSAVSDQNMSPTAPWSYIRQSYEKASLSWKHSFLTLHFAFYNLSNSLNTSKFYRDRNHFAPTRLRSRKLTFDAHWFWWYITFPRSFLCHIC